MLVPHKPSKRLHAARRSTDGRGHEDVHVTVVESTNPGGQRVAKAKPSGRTAALNPRIPEKLR
jgi:hypothetical protein